MTRVAVFGAGSWGTSFSLVLTDAGHDVTLWARRQELCDTINTEHENPDYLPGIPLPDHVRATHDPQQALDGAELVVLAVPSQKLRDNLEDWAERIPRQAVVLSLMKGVEVSTTLRMSEVIAQVGHVEPQRVAVLSGPNLSKEIAQRQPAASVIACPDESVATALQAMCHTESFRPYTNTDVVGCELGGATKNVIALAVGCAVGLGFGDNATASVITRGLAETSRLGQELGAHPATFSGLAGLGDLVATCSSPLSRNRTFGEHLGQGRSVDEIVASTRQVAEGVKSCASIESLAHQHGVEMPIVEHVSRLIAGDMSPADVLRSLVSRDPKSERH